MSTVFRQPDFDVSAMLKDNPACKGRVGVAWQNPDGSIGITLNPFVQLPKQDGNLVLTLFKRQADKRKPTPKFTGPPSEEDDDMDYMDALKH